jgi:hypothetical protein
LTQGHVVTNEIGDRVRLACAGRTLNDKAVRLRQLSHNRYLIVIERLWKEDIISERSRFATNSIRTIARCDRLPFQAVPILRLSGLARGA